MIAIDLTGRAFGHLAVLHRAEDRVRPNGDRVAMWACRCTCGTVKSISGDHLRRGAVGSCGCRGIYEDLAGARFGKLTVVRRTGGKVGGGTWECICDCGRTRTCPASELRRPQRGPRSCGCQRGGRGPRRSQRKAVVGYRPAHKRVEAERGKASTHLCVDCGRAASDWSYDGLDANAIAESSGRYAGLTYSLDVSRYQPRCRSCHIAHDHLPESCEDHR